MSSLLLNSDALLMQIIHRQLSYDNLVGNTTSAAKVKLPGVLEINSSSAMRWGILSSPGTTHAPHFDPSGVHTVIHVHEGGKLFFLSEAKEGKPLLLPVSLGAARKSNSLLTVPLSSHMPPGQIHSVLTVQPLTEGLIPSNPYPPRPTVMSGYHFYNTSTLEMTLEASILHALWHDIWTNTQLDILDAWKARMLASITIICDNCLAATKPPSGHRTQTKGSSLSYEDIRLLPLDLPNLFALLYMCRYWKVLRSLPLQGATEEDNEDEDTLADDFCHLVTMWMSKLQGSFRPPRRLSLLTSMNGWKEELPISLPCFSRSLGCRLNGWPSKESGM